MPIDDFALFLMHPDYAELVAEEYFQWVTYGMLLGYMVRQPIPGFTSHLEQEINWLEDQHEMGCAIAKHEAKTVIKQPD